jgi:hypothetical protein
MKKSKIQGVASTRAMHRQRGLRIAMAAEPNRIGEKQKNVVVVRIGQKGLHVQLGIGVAKQPPRDQGGCGFPGWRSGEERRWGRSVEPVFGG